MISLPVEMTITDIILLNTITDSAICKLNKKVMFGGAHGMLTFIYRGVNSYLWVIYTVKNQWYFSFFKSTISKITKRKISMTFESERHEMICVDENWLQGNEMINTGFWMCISLFYFWIINKMIIQMMTSFSMHLFVSSTLSQSVVGNTGDTCQCNLTFKDQNPVNSKNHWFWVGVAPS